MRDGDYEQFVKGVHIVRIDEHVAAAWPKDHNFNFYALKIQDIYLIDWYGGANTIPVNEYLTTNLNSM